MLIIDVDKIHHTSRVAINEPYTLYALLLVVALRQVLTNKYPPAIGEGSFTGGVGGNRAYREHKYVFIVIGLGIRYLCVGMRP